MASLEQDRKAYQQRQRMLDACGELGAFFRHPDINEHLIGLWRFHELGQPRLWCATYAVGGKYYDVTGKRTPNDTLRAVLRGVRKLKKGLR